LFSWSKSSRRARARKGEEKAGRHDVDQSCNLDVFHHLSWSRLDKLGRREMAGEHWRGRTEMGEKGQTKKGRGRLEF